MYVRTSIDSITFAYLLCTDIYNPPIQGYGLIVSSWPIFWPVCRVWFNVLNRSLCKARGKLQPRPKSCMFVRDRFISIFRKTLDAEVMTWESASDSSVRPAPTKLHLPIGFRMPQACKYFDSSRKLAVVMPNCLKSFFSDNSVFKSVYVHST